MALLHAASELDVQRDRAARARTAADLCHVGARKRRLVSVLRVADTTHPAPAESLRCRHLPELDAGLHDIHADFSRRREYNAARRTLFPRDAHDPATRALGREAPRDVALETRGGRE